MVLVMMEMIMKRFPSVQQPVCYVRACLPSVNADTCFGADCCERRPRYWQKVQAQENELMDQRKQILQVENQNEQVLLTVRATII